MSGRRIKIHLTPRELKDNPDLVDLVKQAIEEKSAEISIGRPKSLSNRYRPNEEIETVARSAVRDELDRRNERAARGEHPDGEVPVTSDDGKANDNPNVEIARQMAALGRTLVGYGKRGFGIAVGVEWVVKRAFGA